MANASSKEYPLKSSKSGPRQLLTEVLNCTGRNLPAYQGLKGSSCIGLLYVCRRNFKHLLKKSPETLTTRWTSHTLASQHQPPQPQARGWVWGEFGFQSVFRWGWHWGMRHQSLFQVCFWGNKKGTLENDVDNGLFLHEGLVSFPTKSAQQKLSTLEDYASLVMLFFIKKNCVHALQITLKLCKYQQAICLSLGIFNK